MVNIIGKAVPPYIVKVKVDVVRQGTEVEEWTFNIRELVEMENETLEHRDMPAVNASLLALRALCDHLQKQLRHPSNGKVTLMADPG